MFMLLVNNEIFLSSNEYVHLGLGSRCSICRFVCSVLWTIVVHPVFIGVPVAQSVDLCGVLWTIVVHPVFIGVPVGQCVDLCGVLWTIVVHLEPSC
jgi:DMSO/TMAO reductase YedYZ molybdopterin-dependent catalytic subunit